MRHQRVLASLLLTTALGGGTVMLATPNASGQIIAPLSTPTPRLSAIPAPILAPHRTKLAATLEPRTGFSASPINILTNTQTSVTGTILSSSSYGVTSGYGVAPLSATQDAAAITPGNPEQALKDDEDETVLFEADSISRASADSPLVAEGNIRAFFGQRYLTAERLSYDPATDIVIANGQVSITDEKQETIFAERVELSGDLRDGIAENFTALLAENARVAADSAVRRQGARTDLNKVVYTACDVCKDDGSGKVPTWRIKSLRVTRDEERRVIRFRHAFLELKGIPVLYTPFVQAPDPSVERQSGFLTPTIGTSSRLSAFIEVPYYFALSNHLDFTFFPKFTLSDGTLWQGELRRAGRNSFHAWAGGVTDYDRPAQDGFGNLLNENGVFVDRFNNIRGENNELLVASADNPTDRPEDAPGVRWYYFGRGYNNITDNFRVGYDIERTSDDTFLRRYSVQRRGDLRLEFDRSNTNRLRSNINAAWRHNGSTLTADSYLFQGLRATDVAAQTPYVLPLLNFRHDFDRKVAGGVFSINANFASLQRTGGTDSRRITGQAMWSRDYITRGGHRFHAFAELRGDAFFFQDLDEGTENILAALVPRTSENEDDTTSVVGRFAPTAGVEWSFPLARNLGGTRLLLEPRVQLIASPSGRNSSDIINEDSQSTEFDYSNLFSVNKANGFDAFEDGQRANVGVSGSVTWPNGIKIETAIGQQFRLQNTNAFSFGTGRGDLFTRSVGLGDTRSDFVAEANLELGSKLTLNNRFRFDTAGSLRQVDSTLGFNFWRLNGIVNYVRLEDVIIDTSTRNLGGLTIDTITDLDQINAVQDIEEINALARFKLTKHWSTGIGWRENLRPEFDEETGMFDNGTIRQDFLIGYRDECSSFDIIFRRDLTRDRGLQTDTSVLIRFTLTGLTGANFGTNQP